MNERIASPGASAPGDATQGAKAPSAVCGRLPQAWRPGLPNRKAYARWLQTPAPCPLPPAPDSCLLTPASWPLVFSAALGVLAVPCLCALALCWDYLTLQSVFATKQCSRCIDPFSSLSICIEQDTVSWSLLNSAADPSSWQRCCIPCCHRILRHSFD